MGNIKALSFFKKFKIQTMNFSEGHRLFALYLLGIIIGTLLMNIFGKYSASKIGIYGKYLTNDTNNIKYEVLNKGMFFIYCIKKYFIQIVIILMLNCTSKQKIINGTLCMYKGFVMSVLICSATIVYGSGGIILFLISVFPHYLIYVPMFIYSIYFGLNIKKYIKNKNYISGILKCCIIEGVMIIGTSFFEVYLNVPLIISMFGN